MFVFLFLFFGSFTYLLHIKNYVLHLFAEKVKKESAKGCTSSLNDGQRDVKPSQKGAKNTFKKGEPVHRLFMSNLGLDLHTINLMGHRYDRYNVS